MQAASILAIFMGAVIQIGGVIAIVWWEPIKPLLLLGALMVGGALEVTGMLSWLRHHR